MMFARCLAATFVALAWLAWTACVLLRKRRTIVTNNADDAEILVVWASQTGFAQQLAQRTARALGARSRLLPIDQLDASMLANAQRVLFVASTTGEGDPPDHASGFVRDVMSQTPQLSHLHCAVLALGDRDYDDFCAFGHRLDAWLRQHGAQPLFDLVEVDNADPAALRHWQHQLGLLGGNGDAADWEPAQFQHWTLHERRVINPGSAGWPAFHVALVPPNPAVQWQAGDIAEIRVGENPQVSREYSIASLPAEGMLMLLVRRQLRSDGTPGLGSACLCDRTAIGDAVGVRLRSNPNFHVPAPSRPMILIGNGTGIAGLRALLAQRIAEGARRNWLLFGERQRAHDFFYGHDIERWQREGFIEHLHLAFSRDGEDAGTPNKGVDDLASAPRKTYVQDLLHANAAKLREWATQGAAIYVCGSLQGMAPSIDAVLRDTLGDEAVETMLADGRYRRDVY